MLNIMSFKNTLGVFNTVLGKIDDVHDKDIEIKDRDLALFSADGNIIKLLSAFIIEPLIVVSDDLKHEDTIGKIITLNLNMFTAYYTQAFNIMTNAYGFNGITAINTLSSNGSYGGYNKSFKPYSDDFGLLSDMTDEFIAPGLEARGRNKTKKKIDNNTVRHNSQTPIDLINDAVDKRVKDTAESVDKLHEQLLEAGDAKKTASATAISEDVKKQKIPDVIQRSVDLTMHITGEKMIGGKETVFSRDIVIPVIIKANVLFVSHNDIMNLASSKDTTKTGFMSRFHEMRSGGIKFWNDFIMADDLVKQYRDKKLKDKSKLIEQMTDRTLRSRGKMLSTGGKGLGQYYSMLVVSRYQEARYKQVLKGDMLKNRYANKLMENTKSMMLNIVDIDQDRVLLYTNGLDGVSNVRFKELDKKTKESEDVSDLLKLMHSSGPSL